MIPDYTQKLWWATPDTKKFFHNKYFPKHISIQDRIDEMVTYLQKISGDAVLAERYRELLEYGHITQPSPAWSNFGTDRNDNLSISCVGSYVDDSINGFAQTISETMVLTKASAGTSTYIGDIRAKGSPISTGGFADGPMPIVSQINDVMSWVTQGNRRGRIAIYMNIDNPHIEEFLDIGTEGSPHQEIMTAVCVPDWFMERVESKDMDWDGMRIWAKVIQTRKETGFPYVFYSDTVNRNKPQWYIDQNLKIHASNLCAEIAQPSSPDETFACNLMALNLVTRSLWPTHIYDTVVRVMDWIQQDYIDSIRDRYGFERVHRYAVRHRALGIGVCGWHDLLQSQNIAVDSIDAYRLNHDIFKELDEQTLIATKKLAQELGECPVGRGYGVRNATRIALMPTTSSAFILGGVSQSIEMKNSNYYVKDFAGGTYTYKNPYLKKILVDKGYDTRDIWQSILLKGGSVQHLNDEILTPEEKNVFKTAFETSQLAIVKQAAQRQKFIDQAQSLNLFLHADVPTREINALMIEAWKSGIKTLYYHRSTNKAQEFSRSVMACETCAV